MTSIAVKPTWYNGVFFRSRLEARWAVFFDALGISWRYEPEKYDTPHGPYIPDFEIDLYSGTTLIEVKPDSWFRNSDTSDASRYDHVARSTGTDLFVTGSLVPLSQIEPYGRYCSDIERMEKYFGDGGWDVFYDFTICPYCLSLGIEFEARSARMTCCSGRRTEHKNPLRSDRDHQGNHVKLLDAYTAALSARFEDRRTA